jgi:hypothetical protein
MLSHLDEPGGNPGNEGGMQVRTARLDVRAKSEDGRLSGRFMVGADRASGGIEIEYAYADLALPQLWFAVDRRPELGYIQHLLEHRLHT